MPEGDTLHRLARSFLPWQGKRLEASSPQGRFEEGAEVLNGGFLTRSYARGKHLFLRVETSSGQEVTLHLHLGLYGRVHLGTSPSESPSVRLRLEANGQVADVIGANKCEVLSAEEVQEKLATLGLDPLAPVKPLTALLPRLRKLKQPMGQVLMRQDLFSGLGNIYRAELLWRSAVSPFLEARYASDAFWHKLFQDARVLMEEGVQRGFIVTREELREVNGGTPLPHALQNFYVYKHEGEACPRCGGLIEGALHWGRRLYWCVSCQSLEDGAKSTPS